MTDRIEIDGGRRAPPLSAVSMFSNCGAGDVGFARAGFKFSVMAELVASRLGVALRNHPRARGVGGDLRETWLDVVTQWRQQHGNASPALLAACPPCQGMSTARSDRGPEADPEAGSRDTRNLLVLPIARVVAALGPRFVVVENVPAFLRRRVTDPESGATLSAARLLVRLLAPEYEVYPFLADLADFGVPQTRKRAFLTFVRRGSDAERILTDRSAAPYPVPTHAADHGGAPVSFVDALGHAGLAPLDAGDEERARDKSQPLHFVPVWPERQYRMVAAIPAGSGASAWDNDRCESCGRIEMDEDAAVCSECSRPLLRPVVHESGEFRLVSGFRRSSYRRMSPSFPAATITTASGRVGSSRTLHPFENRVLSPVECALLQTIPLDFKWGTVLTERGAMELRAMIGEAVPPRFTEKHGEVLAALIRGREDRPLITLADRRCAAAQQKLFS